MAGSSCGGTGRGIVLATPVPGRASGASPRERTRLEARHGETRRPAQDVRTRVGRQPSRRRVVTPQSSRTWPRPRRPGTCRIRRLAEPLQGCQKPPLLRRHRPPSPAPPAPARSSSHASPETDDSQTPATSGPSQPSPAHPAHERSTTANANAEQRTTKPCEHSPTASSASSTAASDTTPPTTKRSPGHTRSPQPLDTYTRGMSRASSSRDLRSGRVCRSRKRPGGECRSSAL